MIADVLIRGARVIDTYAALDTVCDIAVKDGLIADATAVTSADTTVDAGGCILTPGLVDFHMHVAAGQSELAVYPESQCFPTGVTTAVDAGTTGSANFESFLATSRHHRVRLFAFLHAGPAGIPTVRYPECHDPAHFDVQAIRALFRKYPDVLLGLKVRQSRSIVGKLGLEPLRAAIAIADDIGCRVACHTTDAPATTAELAGLFRPGDVFAHVYHGRGATILDESGTVLPAVQEARARGVIFDAASGRSHFSLDVAGKAIGQGFLPDIISSDLTTNNHWKPGRVFSLPYVMSKCLALGMTLPDVIDRVTARPAALLGTGMARELGSLAVGTVADIALHRPIPSSVTFEDAQGGQCRGGTLLRTELTLREGNIVYRAIELQ